MHSCQLYLLPDASSGLRLGGNPIHKILRSPVFCLSLRDSSGGSPSKIHKVAESSGKEDRSKGQDRLTSTDGGKKSRASSPKPRCQY